MKIYTRTGDTGDTSLYGGKRVKKNDALIEAIGEVDELNSILGIAIGHVGEETIKERLYSIQHSLFAIGSRLASSRLCPIPDSIPILRELDIENLEQWIDGMQEELPVMTQFILPGGSQSAAWCFFARAAARRAERWVICARTEASIDLLIVQFLNRLSDALFVLARYLNMRAGAREVVWRK